MANILAVDDNLELCKLIRTTLERDGHRVETRQAGRDLTEALCRWADCILLDVMMPGEDGFAVCRRIRSLTEAPILFLSARTDEAAVLEGVVDAVSGKLALDVPARAAGAGAQRAAALDHKAGDDTVEGQAVVKAFLDQLFEILTGDGGNFLVQLDVDDAAVFHSNANHNATILLLC